ncbi:RNA polymerase II associated protein 1 S homeolog isoform X1 [Xenopus laevis]|uniref:RNA polymerase II associated protein 1 S homeolog isoform X1 n=1 Tax=Xenopus laevis TaxID=8355 RepID=A0A8J0TEQ2_XENLA|nr:RNA polymerase II associated protein 1 S homeolog isoform X1 [Xenopus laevis]
MLSRPKPGESEEDLLQFQHQFLAAKTSAAAQLVRKADKRKGDDGKSAKLSPQATGGRDVVTLQEFPDLPPILTPAPTKKSKFAREKVRFADEDPEEILEQHDQHITTVFSKIIERDTSGVPIVAPVSTGLPFPKVFHRSQVPSQDLPCAAKKSIFAQQMAARRAAEQTKEGSLSSPQIPSCSLAGPTSVLPSNVIKPTPLADAMEVEKSTLITGQGLGISAGQEEAQKIHEENMKKLRSMSNEEKMQEQEILLSQLDPKLVDFLKSKKCKKTTDGHSSSVQASQEPQTVHLEEPQYLSEDDTSGMSPSGEKEMAVSGHLPVKPQKEWVHMDTVEFEKLEWMKDLPLTKQSKTKKGMQARFSLKGDLIPPNSEIPTHMGLHHHGEEAERAGYSLQEFFHLSRSQFIQQRTLSLQVLGHIVQKAKQGEFSAALKGSVLQLLLDAGFLFLLRFSIDDTAENVIAAAVRALRSLLVSPEDEEYLDMTFLWYQGATVFPFLPNEESEDEEEEVEEGLEQMMGKEERKKVKEEKKSDPDVARYDVIKGLLKTKLLHRLRYILEVVRPAPHVVLDIFDILTYVARHSMAACSQLLDCPRLIETVVQEFLPIQWSMQVHTGDLGPTNLYGIPCSAAMKFLRVLGSSGRHAAARLLHKFDLKKRLSRFVAQEPQDLPLQKEEAERMSMETFRMWAVAAGYGQACDLYRELYPVLMGFLQSLPHLIFTCRGGNKVSTIFIQRAASVLTLLTRITQTAGWTAEIEAQLRSVQEENKEQTPPPSVSWDQVTGLLLLVEGCLRKCLEEVSSPSTWEMVKPLATASLNFVASYYQAASRQPSLDTVICNEELERLTAEVLLPFLHHPAATSMWDLLKSCSAVCNPGSCAPLPESVPSIVTLGCTGGKTALTLAGTKSSFPVLTSVLNLVCNICNIHKGMASKFAFLLESKGLLDYLWHICEAPSPAVTPSSAWVLRHEYHLQYYVLSLKNKVASLCPDGCHHASVFHSVSVSLLSRLLPGSEYMAYQLISGFTFNPSFLPEGAAGGPEAADLADILHITPNAKNEPPKSVAYPASSPSRGVLLKEAYKDLPAIRACYLAHLSHMEQDLSRSKFIYQERTCSLQSAMLPETRGPILPFDWPFLPLINLYNKVTNAETRGNVVNTLPPDLVNKITRNLQWLLLLESWRSGCLKNIPTAAKLARIACVFLTGGDLFLEGSVHTYTTAILMLYSQNKCLESLNLDVPIPGLASFYDFYMDLLEQFEGVSFGDPLFGTFVLLPLQRRFSVQLKQAVFGECVSCLRSLSVSLKELPVPLALYTSPCENNLHLLHLYFRTLVTGALRQTWCPVLYVVAVAHVNNFIFSQDRVAQEVDAARKSFLRKIHLLVDKDLRKHLLFYKQLSSESPVGFDMYEQLPPIRERHLKTTTEKHHEAKGEND